MKLRVIVVTTRDALNSMPSEHNAIRTVAHALLARLEAEVLDDGADQSLLEEIAEARGTL